MSSQSYKAYVITGYGSTPITSGGGTGATISAFAYVLAPDNSDIVGLPGVQVSAHFDYGDSNQAIRESIADAIRANIPTWVSTGALPSGATVDVNFITG